MAASQRPTERRASRCTPVTARATLVFEIAGYSLHKGMGIGKFIWSTTVSVGGHQWCILYYPDGDTHIESQGHISVYLELLSKGAKEPLVETTAITVEVQMPPSDLAENFRKLLEAAEEADMTFEVEGEIFPAHKIVLAAWSPVFKAELSIAFHGQT
ncbi:BTB/POZ and MATH domain-containing protein 2-like [Aegilops tauschii subsp. strangulata]|uniref:BTB/POZ and MATH domain-containing protein 2-like n=1 Tax=Aegilops tauschii subsp. strangulata TaxID=200361 RepID=UPI003CC83C3F